MSETTDSTATRNAPTRKSVAKRTPPLGDSSISMPIGEDIMNDQVKQLAELQARTFEPMRAYLSLASDTMERVIRKNYELMGDIVEFSVKQFHFPKDTDNLGDMASAKMAETRAFTETLGHRAKEYLELGNQFNQRARQAVEEAAASAKAA